MKDLICFMFELVKGLIYIPFLLVVFLMVMIVFTFDSVKHKVFDE